MDIDKILSLDDENKIKLLKQIIENDLNYWKKILLLLSINENYDNSELIENIVNSKRIEMDMFYKIYNIEPNNELKEKLNFNTKENLSKLMENIINNNVNSTEYKIACSQTLEILKHIPKYYYNKINNNFILRLEENIDPVYKFSIDKNIEYSKLNLTKDTEDLLLIISNKFWKNENEQIYIEDIYNKNN